MKKKSLLHHTRALAPAVLGAGASVLFVAVITFAATTINDNVNTGGTLTVSGASTQSGAATFASTVNASSTLQVDGTSLFYGTLSAGAATNSPTTTFNVTGNGYFTGALGVGTATSSSAGLQVFGMGVFGSGLDVRGATSTFAGQIGLVGSSTPYLEVGIAGDVAIGGALGTSTLSLDSTTKAGCIELRAANGAWIRLYPGNGGATTTDNRVHVGAAGIGLVIGQGRCQTGNE